MATDAQLDRETIKTALDELDRLSRAEYGCKLEELVADCSTQSVLRLQRIAGIVLKRPFAREGPPVSYSETRARRSWPWMDDSPESLAGQAPHEFRLLNDLRMPGPWNQHNTAGGGGLPWDQFKLYADHERGLFKILVLYVDDKLKKRKGRTLKEYLEADESRRTEAGLDLATLLFEAAATAPLAAFLGISTLAVAVALIGIQYGYRRMTDPQFDNGGDHDA